MVDLLVKIKENKKLVFISLSVIIVLIMLLSFFNHRKPVININKYTQVTFTGKNGDGEAYVYFDMSKLSKKTKKVMVKHANKNLEKIYKEVFGEYNYALEKISEDQIVDFFLSDCVKFTIEPSMSLKNGDKVKISFDIDDEELYGVKVKDKDFKVKVKGLKK